MKRKDLYQKREHFFLESSPTFRGALVFCVVIGFVTFVSGMLFGQQTRAWGAFLFNAFFFFSIALAGTAFANMQDVINATWGRPIKRLHESFSAFLIPSSALLALFLIFVKFNLFHAGEVYKWIQDPSIVEHLYGKNIWLRPNFMIVRDLFCLAGIVYLSRIHYKLTVAGDKAFLAEKFDEGVKLGQHARKRLNKWSAPMLVVYSILYSILAFDLLMSLAPTWVSTLWAGWQFSVMMQTMLAALLLVLFFLKDKPVGQYIEQVQFHDVGKLIFGFTAFYAYLTYAHVLTYWYTNMPEETSYFMTRLQKPWVYFVLVAPFISFLLPFILLVPKAAKWTSTVAIPVCILVLFAQWLNMLLVVTPEVTDAGTWTFPWIELGLLIGFFAGFLLALARRVRRIPMLNLTDPLLFSHSHH